MLRGFFGSFDTEIARRFLKFEVSTINNDRTVGDRRYQIIFAMSMTNFVRQIRVNGKHFL